MHPRPILFLLELLTCIVWKTRKKQKAHINTHSREKEKVDRVVLNDYHRDVRHRSNASRGHLNQTPLPGEKVPKMFLVVVPGKHDRTADASLPCPFIFTPNRKVMDFKIFDSDSLYASYQRSILLRFDSQGIQVVTIWICSWTHTKY